MQRAELTAAVPIAEQKIVKMTRRVIELKNEPINILNPHQSLKQIIPKEKEQGQRVNKYRS